ncbi:YncE family protein [Mariniflexile jejuense]|uniref:YncE family protein n=1 Tax=Mariniflexile jejuense TaxID=1173582 RepID=A0ABW3JES7_9FLAO
MIKKIKYLLLLLVVLLLAVSLTIYLVREPSYNIQTNGKLYIVNKRSRDVTVFDLMKGEKLTNVPIDIESHAATPVRNQGCVVIPNYNTNENKVQSLVIINAKTDKLDKTIVFEEGLALDGIIAHNESNKVLVVSRINNKLFVVDIENNAVEKSISTEQEIGHIPVLHPHKPIAYVTNTKSGSVSVIDLKLNKVIKIIPCGFGTQGIDITPDGSELWVTNTMQNSMVIINTISNQIIKTIKTGRESIKLKFSKDGKYCFVVNSRDGTISIYNQKSRKKIKTIQLHGKTTILQRLLYHTPRPVNILMHPNGLYAFVSNSNACKVEIIDMKTLTIVSTIKTGNVPEGLALVE